MSAIGDEISFTGIILYRYNTFPFYTSTLRKFGIRSPYCLSNIHYKSDIVIMHGMCRGVTQFLTFALDKGGQSTYVTFREALRPSLDISDKREIPGSMFMRP